MRSETLSPKYRQIYDHVRTAIVAGDYAPGSRLPSEADLASQFDTSRITVARAFQELHMQGFVERRVGAGTYVRSVEPMEELRFGLLIPDLGQTEIFEPICRGMAGAKQSQRFSLLWGSNQAPQSTSELQIESVLQHFLSVGVSGVFFAPFEHRRHKNEANQRIVRALDEAGVQVILLDRDVDAYPNRSHYDVVGIDNRRAGYMLAQHLIDRGCRRIVFIARKSSAPTVDARIMGYRDALLQNGLPPDPSLVHWMDPDDAQAVESIMRDVKPDAAICANDITSMRLMRTLTTLSFEIPGDLMVASFDDVKHAELLMVPLTTIRQPCSSIGAEAIAAMLERVANPELPARDIFLDFTLMIRESTSIATTDGEPRKTEEEPRANA
jgi:GntR family transcriptional regulator, arabinose operon transcriptional repressor